MRVLFLVLSLSLTLIGYSQQDSTEYTNKEEVIITNDGGEFIGVVKKEDAREIMIDDRDRGEVIIPKYVIKTRCRKYIQWKSS